MTTDLVPSAVDPEISAAIQIYDRLAPLKDALGLSDLTRPELELFAMVAYHTGLDPFTRQIYAVKRKGKVVHQTGIDGYRSIAESKGAGQYAGSDEATFEACDCGQEPDGHPKIARVVVHRILPSGHVVDQTGIARWHELYPGSGNDGFMWRQMPHNQLSKCAEANGLRKAFPRVLGGVYITEEMQQANTIEGTAQPVAATARDRIAARRAEVEAPTGATETADEVEGEATEQFPVAPGQVSIDAIAPSGELSLDEFRVKARDKFTGTAQVRPVAEELFSRSFHGDLAGWGLSPADLHKLAVELGLVE